VHLRRAFGFGATNDFDPFLLLDDFRNDVPEDYLAGFPWHPHRGIETITYVLAGTVEHGDSMGNHGVISSGDVQWMTAGSGIIHQEMPKGDPGGRMHGFQLWANLPSTLKLTARYQEVKETYPQIPMTTQHSRSRHLCDFLVKIWPARRDRGRSDLSGRIGFSGSEEDSSSRDHSACLRLRFCRERKIL
jgi:redox-sensitive bicupin YhaK (pirin superfamily)